MFYVPPFSVIIPFAEMALEAFPETFRLNVPLFIVMVLLPVFIAFTSAETEVTLIVPPEIRIALSPASMPSEVDEIVKFPPLITKPSECKPSDAAAVIATVPFRILILDEVFIPCFFKPAIDSVPELLITIGPSVVIVPFFTLDRLSESVFVVPVVNKIFVVFPPMIVNGAPLAFVSERLFSTKFTS